MKRFLKRVASKLTMRKVAYAFTDSNTGERVYYFMDCYDQLWVAKSKYSVRVRAENYMGHLYP